MYSFVESGFLRGASHVLCLSSLCIFIVICRWHMALGSSVARPGVQVGAPQGRQGEKLYEITPNQTHLLQVRQPSGDHYVTQKADHTGLEELRP